MVHLKINQLFHKHRNDIFETVDLASPSERRTFPTFGLIINATAVKSMTPLLNVSMQKRAIASIENEPWNAAIPLKMISKTLSIS